MSFGPVGLSLFPALQEAIAFYPWNPAVHPGEEGWTILQSAKPWQAPTAYVIALSLPLDPCPDHDTTSRHPLRRCVVRHHQLMALN